MAVAEVVIASGHALVGQIADGVLVCVLVNLGSSWQATDAPDAPDRSGAALHALSVVALMRVIAIGLPLHDWNIGTGHLVIAALTIFTVLRVAPLVRIPFAILIRRGPWRSQCAALGAGLVLGLAAYVVGAPASLHADVGGPMLLLGLAGVVAAAVAEELLFRGLAQISLEQALGRVGVLMTSGLFACTYLGFRSAPLVLVMALAGLTFGQLVRASGVVGAAIGGHVVLGVGADVVWPAVFGWEERHHASEPWTTMLLGLALVSAIVLSVRPHRQREVAGQAGR